MATLEVAPDVESGIARYAADFSLADVPEEVLTKARLVLLDTIGVCIRGAEAAYVGKYATRSAEFGVGGDGQSTVFATRGRGPPVVASRVNAAGGTTLELDEGNQRSAHMGIHTVPAAMAVAEHLGADGASLLEAVVLSYEVSARLGDVVRPMKSGLHPHGAWAPVGAALATGSLLEFTASTFADAIRIAVNPFVTGHWAACLEGATVRNFYPGIACAHGLDAALLADSGVTGVENAIQRCLLPYTAMDALDGETLVRHFDTLGEGYYLEDSYFKIHAACRYTHAPIEAIEQLLSAHDFRPADLERIVVRTFENGTLLSETRPENVLSAKFSTPYALAARLVLGTSSIDAFAEDQVERADVRAVADLVEVETDDAFDRRAAEGHWGAEVEVTTADGEMHSATVRDARGGGETPFTRQEILGKFDDLVGDATSPSTATRLRETLLDVESVGDAGTMLSPLR